VAAAGNFAPARVRSDPGNKRPGQLQWRERKGYWGSIGDSTSREGELVVQLQWQGGGSYARPGRAFYGRRGERRFAQHQVIDTSAVWAWHGGAHGRSTAATPLGGRWHGQRDVTCARVARGARGEGQEGGSARAVPQRAVQRTVAGLSVRAQPRVQVCGLAPAGERRRAGASSDAETFRGYLVRLLLSPKS
jgi:hypothetical protein